MLLICYNLTIKGCDFMKENFINPRQKSHTLNLIPKYFDLIKNGKKTLEGRLHDEKRQNFYIGDQIFFYKEPERKEMLQTIILDKYLFKNFDEMAKQLNKAELGFESQTTQEMIDTYRSIYSKEDEEKYGVAIFRIQML